MDAVVYDTLRMIAADLSRARADIRALRPNELSRDGLPGAGAELDAIVRDTEAATNTIMSAAEAILAADTHDHEAYQAFVSGQALAVFEACAFQDITGQRISKVVGVLRQIEERMARLAEAVDEDAPLDESPDERRSREQLLHGPALNGPETDQSAVDAMFAETATQTDIDALFDDKA